MVYTPVILPSIFSEKKELKKTEDTLPLTQLILVKKYVQQDENDVVTYIQEVVQHPEQHDSGEEVLHLPQFIKQDIIDGKEGILQFLKDTTRAPRPKKEKQHYLNVTYGMFPSIILPKQKKPEEWYRGLFFHEPLIKRGYGLHWVMEIAITKSIPSAQEIKLLIKHGVHESDTFHISERRYDHKDAKDIIDCIYTNIIPNLANVEDISDKVRTKHAFESLAALRTAMQEMWGEQLLRGYASLKQLYPKDLQSN
ncbi:MAG: hypothetical protein V1725_00925 [archaeon]